MIYLKQAVSALFTVLAIVACSDVVNMNDDWDDGLSANGAPAVRKITASSDTTKAISIAILNQSISIFGDNLSQVEEVRINDIKLDLSQVYAKRHRLELIVPRILPSEVTNTVTIRTRLGETTVPLTVTIPDLKITGFLNEFAADEDTVEIVGSDFDLYQIDSINATVKFNSQDIKIFNCSESSFSIEVPKGTSTEEASHLTISSPEINGTLIFPFREKGIPIMTNDERTWSGGPWWATGYVEVGSDSNPTAPLFKRYIPVKKTCPTAWDYTNVLMSHFWLDDSATDLLANPENYYVKMEILTSENTPLSKEIHIGNSDGLRGDMYKWDPVTSDNVSINTQGKWMTVALEAADVFRGKDGKKTSLLIAQQPYVNTDEFNHFKVAMNRELPGDVEFYFWNIRFVKKIATK